MRKIILSCAFGMLFIISASAQSFSTGIRAGINIGTYQSEGIENAEYATGLNFAIPFEFAFNEGFAIQPELHYIQKGVKAEVDIFGLNFESKIKTSYLEIPVLIKGSFGSEAVKANIFGGPAVGYAIIRKAKVKGPNGETETKEVDFTTDSDPSDNRIDLGVVLGIGGEFMIGGASSIVLDARYNLDLNDNQSFDGDKPDSYNEIYHRGIGITVGYMYNFGY